MIEQVIETFRYLLANPTFAGIALIIAIALYWFQRRLFRRVLHKQAQANRSGWTTPAITSHRRHQTGIGTETILVMRPPRRLLKVAFWTLLFFGGGAAFFWFVVLPKPEEHTVKNWLTFAIMCAFSSLALVLAFTAFTRIRVSADDLVLHRLFRRPKRFALKEISSVELGGKNPATGVKLFFLGGDQIKLLASYEGYAQVLQQIQSAHADLPRILAMGRLIDSANARTMSKRKTQ